ncbi:MAG: sugar phosphate isomerase/epimerase [Clostridia bacterium]|nr:sugar phosphate isomerase/epimerase [Clostridia bacterium]
MLISTSTALRNTVGYEKNIELLKKAGFTAFDLTLDGPDDTKIATYFAGDDYLEKAYKLREFADSIGLPCNQSHAPFGSHYGDATPDTDLFKKTVRSMEVASILGAKGIVVHPMQFKYHHYYKDELKEINYRFYNDLLPYAEKFGIIMYTENMWNVRPVSHVIIPSTCSWAEEFCEYIDMIDSPYMKGCLDIGHLLLTGESVSRAIEMLGPDRLAALHIHDVYPQSDAHTIPFLGNVNFDEMLESLKKIGYKGDITFESGTFERHFPTEELQLSALRLTADIGKYFKSKLEE